MKQVVFHNTGEPTQVLTTQVSDRKPQPGRGEVLVKMLASPVNPSDLMFIRGIYGIQPTFPATPGFEGVGIVEASGGGLKGKLFKGKRVAVLNRAGGNWGDYVVLPDSQVIPLSNSLSVDQAATFFVNPATAWIMTQEVLQVHSGQWLLQTAAGSSLGRMIIRLARHCGFKTINIVRRQQQVEELKAIGADHVLVFDDKTQSPDDLRQAVQQITGEAGVRYAIDPVGGATGSAVVSCLGKHGHMLVFGTLSDDPLQFSSRTLMTQSARIEGFWLGNYMDSVGLLFKLKLVKRITGLIQQGILGSEIAQSFDLDRVSDAVAMSEDSAVTGKVLLNMDDAKS
jgi:NADPH:quinone reductase-like Zn-dependent oxidoreductase